MSGRYPSFAIVITAYQAAATVGAAVASALEQTLSADEVIVVDDGSTDDLAGTLAPFADRIKTVRRENGGGAAARNTGAEAMSSEFMAILDADDTYHPRRLEAIAALLDRRPELDLVATDATFVVDGKSSGSFLDHNPFPTAGQREAIFASCFPGGWPAVRIRALEGVGGFDESMRIAYDWDCWLRMILAGSEVGMVAEPLYDYVLHQGSLASSRVPSMRERVRLLEKAAVNPDLQDSERPALECALAAHRDRAGRAAVEAALYGGGSRRDLWRLAASAGLRPRVRCSAALAAALPPLARRFSSPTPSPEERLATNPD